MPSWWMFEGPDGVVASARLTRLVKVGSVCPDAMRPERVIPFQHVNMFWGPYSTLRHKPVLVPSP